MDDAQIIQSIISLLALSLVIFWVYKGYFKPIRTYKECLNQVNNYEFIFMKDKANEIREKALNTLVLSNDEKYPLLLTTGYYYYKKKLLGKSKEYMDEAVKLLFSSQFYYHKGLHYLIEFYSKSGELDKAIGLYNDFLNRQSFDPKFCNIKRLGKKLGIEQYAR